MVHFKKQVKANWIKVSLQHEKYFGGAVTRANESDIKSEITLNHRLSDLATWELAKKLNQPFIKKNIIIF